MINTLPKLDRRFLIAVLALIMTLSVTGVEVRAETVLVETDAAPRGASVAGNKVYRTVAAEVIGQLKKAGYKVIQPKAIPSQYLPKRRRPSAKDWVHVFQRNKPKKMDALVAITVVNRVVRSKAANVSSIDLKAKIYRHGKKKPVAVVDIPSAKDSPMKSGCLGPCMMRIVSENVAKPA